MVLRISPTHFLSPDPVPVPRASIKIASTIHCSMYAAPAGLRSHEVLPTHGTYALHAVNFLIHSTSVSV